MSIILVPVPEYPIFSDEDDELKDPAIRPSQYNEDGSLQVHLVLNAFNYLPH